MLLLKKCKYDPAIYGQLRADYLNRLSHSCNHSRHENVEETRRQELIKDIKDGKLGKRK